MKLTKGSFDPPPMPEIQEALLCIADAETALERAKKSWNKSQLRDAIRSIKDFIAEAESAMEKNDK